MKNALKILLATFVMGTFFAACSGDKEYTLTVDSNNAAWGTTSGSGTYAKGTVVEIAAVANANYAFERWSDGNTDNPRSVTVNNDATYTAIFVESRPDDPNPPSGTPSITVTFGDTVWSGYGLYQFDMEALAGFIGVWQLLTATEDQQLLAGFNMPNTTGTFSGSSDNHFTAHYLENGNNDVVEIDGTSYPHWISAKHVINGNVTRLDLTSNTLSVTIDAPLQNMVDVSEGREPELRNLHIDIVDYIFTAM